ncbi:MAG: dTDP-4-amino-4,6-dideoxygalactose transaminase [Acidobacteria bacterium]|nr:dTDP-4-amino-4,6-dideoxygalactose transaminase [Acidobacteriota bacterium]
MRVDGQPDVPAVVATSGAGASGTGTPEHIPFNRPTLSGMELVYITQAVEKMHVSGDGDYTAKCSQLFEKVFGTPRVLLTTSCTHALEMSALLLDIQPGDEVICPSFTFVSTINAFVLRGAKPVFLDVRSDTLNLDERMLEAAITPRTKAILVVHYGGVGCEMDTIMDIANRHGIKVVEDNAHGLFGKFKGRYLGTFGAMATQSFHETKNFTCGEGGALLINDQQYVERAEILREKGTDRSRFFRGQVDKYTWVDVGSSYLPSDILAAFLYAQLEQREHIQNDRKRIWETYDAALGDWAEANGATRPIVPDYCEQPYHLYYLLMPSYAERTRFIKYLKERGVTSVFHYLPLHNSGMGAQFGGRTGDCPVTEDVSDRLVRLPFYNSLKPEQQEHVIDVIRGFHAG